MFLKEKPGVYGIYCRDTARWYIGASKHPQKRMKDHKRELEAEYKLSRQYKDWKFPYKGEMGRDYARYRDSFEFHVLEAIETTKGLSKAESHWIKRVGALVDGYNTQKEFADRRW